MSKYVEIKEEEIKSILEGKGFQQMNLPDSHERTFSMIVPATNNRIQIRVFTTIQNGVSRECGEDAIRIVLFDVAEERKRPVGSMKKILRVPGWEVRLKERIEQMMEDAFTLKKCPQDHYLVVRKVKKDILNRKGEVWRKKGDKFLGCSHFPECRYSEPYTGTVTDEEIVEALL